MTLSFDDKKPLTYKKNFSSLIKTNSAYKLIIEKLDYTFSLNDSA